MQFQNRKMVMVAFLVTLSLLVACGGGGGGGDTAVNSTGGGSISGTAIKGPVAGATVAALAVNSDGTMGRQIGSALTDAQGNFSLPVGNYSGPVMLRMTGGSYMDEATGTRMAMDPNDALTCAIPFMTANSKISGIHMTPMTSMAQAMAQNMSGGMTQANMTQANQAMGRYFGVSDIVMTSPMDPTLEDSGASASQDMRNYGMSIAAMSQYAKDMEMTRSAQMVTAMMNDASDGQMDGMMGNSQVTMGSGMMEGSRMMMLADAGSRGMASAMSQFLNSPMNKSGLTPQDMQALIDELIRTNGRIQ